MVCLVLVGFERSFHTRHKENTREILWISVDPGGCHVGFGAIALHREFGHRHRRRLHPHQPARPHVVLLHRSLRKLLVSGCFRWRSLQLRQRPLERLRRLRSALGRRSGRIRLSPLARLGRRLRLPPPKFLHPTLVR